MEFLRWQRGGGEASAEVELGRDSSPILLQTTHWPAHHTYWPCGMLVAL